MQNKTASSGTKQSGGHGPPSDGSADHLRRQQNLKREAAADLRDNTWEDDEILDRLLNHALDGSDKGVQQSQQDYRNCFFSNDQLVPL